MLVIRQKMIYREDIKNNPDILYVFGDNLERVGNGGQAKEMRGENNSFGIATKRKQAHGTSDCYMHDTELSVIDILCKEFDNLEKELRSKSVGLLTIDNYYHYKAVVIPTDGLGTGLSKLPEYAPKALKYIETRIKDLEVL